MGNSIGASASSDQILMLDIQAVGDALSLKDSADVDARAAMVEQIRESPQQTGPTPSVARRPADACAPPRHTARDRDTHPSRGSAAPLPRLLAP